MSNQFNTGINAEGNSLDSTEPSLQLQVSEQRKLNLGINGSATRKSNDNMLSTESDVFDQGAFSRMGVTEDQKQRLMSGESIVIDRDGSREFVPALDENVYKKGSAGNKSIEQRIRKKALSEKLGEAATECAKLIRQNQSELLIQYLKTLPREIKLSQIRDKDGYNLLHMATFQNRTKVVQELIAHAKKGMYQYELAEYVNSKTTKDEFTPLHYAAFKGNIHVMKLLIANGADMEARNQFGLNVLHIAAQGDQPISLFYFKSQGMDIYSKDNRNSTPIHWACFSNSEIALVYLLAWYETSKLNLQDCDGFTPLHLTVKSADQL